MPPRYLTTHPDTGEPGLFLDGEIAGLAGPLWIPKTEFPTVGGGSEAQKIARLEADFATLLDSKMPAATAQRVRVRILSLVPLEYTITIHATPGDLF